MNVFGRFKKNLQEEMMYSSNVSKMYKISKGTMVISESGESDKGQKTKAFCARLGIKCQPTGCST